MPAADGKLRFWRNTTRRRPRRRARPRRWPPTRSATSGTRISTTARGRPGLVPHVEHDRQRRRGAAGLGQPVRRRARPRIASRSTATPSGALVFGAGTVQWPWGLDSTHDRGRRGQPRAMQQATVEPLRRHGRAARPAAARPAGRRAVHRHASPPDRRRPRRSSPGNPATASGPRPTPAAAASAPSRSRPTTAPAGIRPRGRETWTYSWTPPAPGPVAVRTRAADDSGNLRAAAGSGGGGTARRWHRRRWHRRGGTGGGGRRRTAAAADRRRATGGGGRAATRRRRHRHGPPARRATGPRGAPRAHPAHSRAGLARGLSSCASRARPARAAARSACGCCADAGWPAAARHGRRRPGPHRDREARSGDAAQARRRSLAARHRGRRRRRRGGQQRHDRHPRSGCLRRRGADTATHQALRAGGCAVGAGRSPAPAAAARRRARRSPCSSSPTPRDQFGRYYAEILRAEGLNAFAVADHERAHAGALADVLTWSCLGEAPSADRAGRGADRLGPGRRQPDRHAARPEARRPARARRRRGT